MRNLLLILTFSLPFLAFGQNLKFKVMGQKDTTVHLVKYFGSKLFYADTAEMKNGVVEFDGSKQVPGMLALLLPGQKYFQFVYNNEDIYLETRIPDFMGSMKVRKSKENTVFMNYRHFISSNKEKVKQLQNERDKLEKDSDAYTKKTDEINTISKKVKAYQDDLIENNPNKLVSKIIYMSQGVDIPDAPKDENGNIIDSSFKYNYFRNHYFDHINLQDDRLVHSPIFHNKLEFYFTKVVPQHYDTIIRHAYALCDQLNPTSKTFEYCVTWLTSHYGKSKRMGMDKVYIYMADKYYCSTNEEGESPAFWMKKNPDKLKELCEKIPVQKNLVLGTVPPNIILLDSTNQKWHDLSKIDAEYTVLYFWDPNCGHCKKVTPKLQTLYEKKFKNRNIEVFGVAKAVGEDFEKWKKFIRDKKLSFTNVGLTEYLYSEAKENARKFVPHLTTIESLNYSQAYDIYSTPQVYILDENKEIVAKRLTISQLEDLLDKLQGKADLEKLFPPEENEDEEKEVEIK